MIQRSFFKLLVLAALIAPTSSYSDEILCTAGMAYHNFLRDCQRVVQDMRGLPLQSSDNVSKGFCSCLGRRFDWSYMLENHMYVDESCTFVRMRDTINSAQADSCHPANQY